jgi:hypothetical protein
VHSALASHPFDGSAITLLVCILFSQRSLHHEFHHPRAQLYSFLVESSCIMCPRLVLLGLLLLLPMPSFLLFASSMPRLQGKSKRESDWQQNRPRLAIRPTPTPVPSHNSSPSSPASSKYFTHSLNGLPPLSSPYACRIKWFEILGNSLGFNPGPIPNLASSSQPAPVAPPNSPENSAPYPSLVHFPPVQYLCEGFLGGHGQHQEKPHSCSDYATCAKV